MSSRTAIKIGPMGSFVRFQICCEGSGQIELLGYPSRYMGRGKKRRFVDDGNADVSFRRMAG